LEPRIGMVNGEPALLLSMDGQARLVVMISVDQTHIHEIRIVGNPDKLKGVNA
jgi:hypothetical protein